MKTRRSFLSTGIMAGLSVPLVGFGLQNCTNTDNSAEKGLAEKAEGKSRSLNILILGGTSFLGPHQIAYALGRGHRISTFTRGKTKPLIYQNLFDKTENLVGDRASDLSALKNKKWDAVIDNSGHDVAWTEATSKLLKDHVETYLYTSSTGVFYPYLDNDIKENHELLKVEPEGIEDEDMKMEYWYGVMKTNSELAAISAFGKDRTIVVRPTYMIGPADKTDRFIHWPIRLSRSGNTLVPGKDEDPVQYIDVRDVAEWMIRLIEEKNVGTYNAAGPKNAQNMHAFIHEAQSAFDVNSRLVFIDDYEFLKDNNILHLVPWIMPTENNYGSARINNEQAFANGLTTRPLVESMKDIHTWWYSDAVAAAHRNKVENDPKSVLMREKELLKAWKNS